MATETKDQVAALLDEGKSAAEIAEKLGKTKATVYSHISNIRKDRGDNEPRKRGRPPKAKVEGEEKSEGKSESSPRQRPPVAGKASEAKADAPAKAKPVPASSNGHSETRFPLVREAIERELVEARKRVTILEKMAETIV